jgi:hypothetical protein
MNRPDTNFTDESLADLLDVSVEVVEAWRRLGVGPAYFEQQTRSGVKRYYTAEAVRAFALMHRVMSGPQATSRLGPLHADSAIVFGGALLPKVKA